VALFGSTLLDDSDRSPVYWYEARRPLPTLLFVLPLILLYEFGVAAAPQAGELVRNGADCWMRSWMLNAGLPGGWLLPVLVVGGLLSWQIVGRYRWTASFDTLTGMFGESLLFALLLVIGGQSLAVCFRSHGFETLTVSTDAAGASSPGARALSFLGAGLYEELMFRLALIPFAFYLLRMFLIPRSVSIGLAVVASSLIFAAAHYLDPQSPIGWTAFADAFERVAADPALWYGFSFRLLAGLGFAVLLLLRGFGITVGCHAFYDLVAGVVMQAPHAG